MNRMTKEEMIEFLKGMDQRRRILEEEKQRVRGSVETLEEAIQRNNFSRNTDESGIIASGFSPDKVLRVLLNSERDIEEETPGPICRRGALYEKEKKGGRIGCQDCIRCRACSDDYGWHSLCRLYSYGICKRTDGIQEH